LLQIARQTTSDEDDDEDEDEEDEAELRSVVQVHWRFIRLWRYSRGLSYVYCFLILQ